MKVPEPHEGSIATVFCGSVISSSTMVLASQRGGVVFAHLAAFFGRDRVSDRGLRLVRRVGFDQSNCATFLAMVRMYCVRADLG